MTQDLKMYTAKDLQEILSIGRDAAYQLMRSENFPSITIGRRKLVEAEALRSWIQQNQNKKISLRP